MTARPERTAKVIGAPSGAAGTVPGSPDRLYAVIGTVTAERNQLAAQLATATGRSIEEVLREVGADVDKAFTAADAELADPACRSDGLAQSMRGASEGAADRRGPLPLAPSPIVITFVTWDPETDGVAVAHDGEVVWQESTFDSLAQYLRAIAPLGVPVILQVEADSLPELPDATPEAG